MSFTLPELPYAYDALQPYMSKETLEYHHDLHHKAYVDNGNKLIAGTEWENRSLEDIVTGTYQAGAVAQNGIFNNASQHWNHALFWQIMGPGEAKKMPGVLDKALTSANNDLPNPPFKGGAITNNPMAVKGGQQPKNPCPITNNK